MRWLVILMLVMLQAQMPTGAAAADHAAPCHAAPAGHHSAHGDGGSHASGQEAGLHEKTRPSLPDRDDSAAHMCPGCSIPGVAPVAELLPPWQPEIAPPGTCAALLSHVVPPHVPPPRPA